MKKLSTLFLALTLTFALTACSSEPTVEPTVEGSFTLTTTSDIEISMSDVASYEAITQTVTEKTQVSENEVEVVGADLKTLLEENGIVQEDVSKIILTAADGYTAEIPADVASSSQILLVYEANGELLDESASPVWVVIPGQAAKYWVKNIVNITVE